MIKGKSSRSREPEQNTSTSAVLEAHGYRLGKIIGKGSYAIVRVAHTAKNDMVAIKIVSKFHAPDEYLRKFLPREIESVKGLAHPNLIRFIQAIESTHRVYIIMEYAEKGTLLEMIRKEKFIEEERSRKWFRQLVDVVQYCHNKGVVHSRLLLIVLVNMFRRLDAIFSFERLRVVAVQLTSMSLKLKMSKRGNIFYENKKQETTEIDIKCDNLLINGADLIKLSDFGFARDRMTERNGVFPLSETYCGSYAYAAPEILNGVPYYAQMADVWSMGIVLYAMVFGKLPFDDTNIKILLRQVQHKVMFPRSPQVSKGCKGLITKILAPARQRVSIGGIRADPWFNKAVKLPEPPGYPSTSTANPKVTRRTTSVGSEKTEKPDKKEAEENTVIDTP